MTDNETLMAALGIAAQRAEESISATETAFWAAVREVLVLAASLVAIEDE